jgi:hypothetical protein
MANKKIHPLQQAWAGGVFDAKITFPRNGYVLRFETVDEALLKRFAATVQVGNVEQREKSDCVRIIFVYHTLNMEDTRELLLVVAPFLSASRTNAAAEMLARIERNPQWRKDHPEKAASCVISPAPSAGV